MLDSTLSRRPQIYHITKKVNKALLGLKFIRPCGTLNLRKQLEELLVTYTHALLVIRYRLQRLANAALRFNLEFTFGAKRDTCVLSLRILIGWLRNDYYREYFMSLFIYRVVRMKIPPL